MHIPVRDIVARERNMLRQTFLSSQLPEDDDATSNRTLADAIDDLYRPELKCNHQAHLLRLFAKACMHEMFGPIKLRRPQTMGARQAAWELKILSRMRKKMSYNVSGVTQTGSFRPKEALHSGEANHGIRNKDSRSDISKSQLLSQSA